MVNSSIYFNVISYEQFIVLQSLHVVIGIFGVVGNSVVIAAYFKFKEVRAFECSHLITALSVGDLICGIGSVLLGGSKLAIPLLDFYHFTRIYCISSAGKIVRRRIIVNYFYQN